MRKNILLIPLFFLLFFLTSLLILPEKLFAAGERTQCPGKVLDLGFTKKLLSIDPLSRPGTCGVRPTKIVMHTTWGITDANGLWEYFETHPEGRYASTQFVVGKDGTILQMLETLEDKVEIGWAVAYYNDDSISIELGHSADYRSKGEVPPAQYNAAIQLVMKLMEAYSIPVGNIEFDTRNTSNVAGSGPIQKETRGIFGHYQLSPDDRTDPGSQFLADFRQDIKRNPPPTDDMDLIPNEPDTPTDFLTKSRCVITRVGNPTTSPTPPAECSDSSTPPGNDPSDPPPPSKGDYAPPIPLSDIGGISTEMASYGGTYDYEGHIEHAGLDISAVAYTPVYAVADGTVSFVRESCADVATSASCRFEITHDSGGLISSYTHVNKEPHIQQGSKVKKGDLIAKVHDWGTMTHLHFEFQSQSQKSSAGVGININPRNHIPEYNAIPVDSGYGGDVRTHTNNRGVHWADDNRDFAETFRNHPPCTTVPAAQCWAH